MPRKEEELPREEAFIRWLGDFLSDPGKRETKDIHEKLPKGMRKGEMTNIVVKAMMTEDTGRHILDSGYGERRGWQERRKIEDNWDELPRATAEHRRNEITFTRNLYHLLTENLEYDLELDKRLQDFMRKSEDYYLEDMRAFVEKISEEGKTGGEFCDNSYNFNTSLDTVIQYCVAYMDDGKGDLIVLQTHNGADVRGGYSTPHAFRGYFDELRVGMSDFYLRCPEFEALSDDEGWDWYDSYGGEAIDLKEKLRWDEDRGEWVCKDGSSFSLD